LGAGHDIELDAAVNPHSDAPPGAPPDLSRAILVHRMTEKGHDGFSLVETPFVASPAILGFYRIPAGAIDQSADIVTAHTDLSGVQLNYGLRDSFRPVTIQVTKLLPNYTSAPNTLITEKQMSALGLTPQPVGWLLETAQPLTAAQITHARHQAAAAGLSIETRTAPDHSLQRVRDYATLAGVLVALGVLAMTIGLIRSETAGDLQTLTAVGAGTRTRRTLTAVTAAALALLAGIIGTAGAYLALCAWHWHHLSYLAHPPYLDLAVIVFGLPIAALLGGWLLSRAPGRISQRRLE
jgi:putative ABC transport system permease protein